MNTAMADISSPSEAHIIDGKTLSAALRKEIGEEVDKLPVPPCLAVILVGDDAGSEVYVRNKIKACEEVGIRSAARHMEADCTADDLSAMIVELNNDPDIHGILLQLPLPDGLKSRTNEFINTISPDKDVDGLTVVNVGRLVAGIKGLVPCTPAGSLHMIHSVQKDLTGMTAVIIGRSLLFGKPMAQLLMAENVTVTTAHSKTRDLPEVARQADILIAATGQAHMVKGDWIKPGAIVIDVGISRIPNPDGGKDKLVGDVLFEEAVKIAGAITPVPGGVGPMTIAYLLKNTLEAART